MIYLMFLKKYFPFHLLMILIFIQGNILTTLIHDLQTERTALVDWLNINKLTINPAETYFIFFHKSRHSCHR